MTAQHNNNTNDDLQKASDRVHQPGNDTANKWAENVEKDTYGLEAEKQLHHEHLVDAHAAHEKVTAKGQLDLSEDIYHQTDDATHQQSERKEDKTLTETAMQNDTAHTYGIRVGYGSEGNFLTAIEEWRADKDNYENDGLKKILDDSQEIS